MVTSNEDRSRHGPPELGPRARVRRGSFLPPEPFSAGWIAARTGKAAGRGPEARAATALRVNAEGGSASQAADDGRRWRPSPVRPRRERGLARAARSAPRALGGRPGAFGAGAGAGACSAVREGAVHGGPSFPELRGHRGSPERLARRAGCCGGCRLSKPWPGWAPPCSFSALSLHSAALPGDLRQLRPCGGVAWAVLGSQASCVLDVAVVPGNRAG